jgi:hypothetical protein
LLKTLTETPAADHAGYDLPADVAELGELVAGLAAEMARIAASVNDVEVMADIMLSARRAGYARGLAVHDDYEAAARARELRAGFQVLQGGRSGGAA